DPYAEPATMNLCPVGGLLGQSGGELPYWDANGNLITVVIPGPDGQGGAVQANPLHDGRTYDPFRDAPNRAAGFYADLSGNELPNAPRFTVSLGAQHTIYLPGGWDMTGRVDW